MSYALPLVFFPVPLAQDTITLEGMILSLVLPLFVFRGINKGNSIYITILIIGMILVVSTSIGWVLTLVLKTNIIPQAVDLFTNLVLLIICIITTKTGALSRFINSIMEIPRGLKILLASTIWISAVLTGLSSMIFQAYPDLPALTLSGVLTAALIILVGTMCPLLIMNYLSSTHYKNQSNLMNKQVQTQLEHYETMSRMNEDIRKFQHDYKNLRICLISYLNQNDIPGALDFLNMEYSLMKVSSHTFETGSVILDALLNEKQMSAASVNITIVFEGTIPENLLDPADICVIFGNAIDNAIEACARLPKEEKKVIGIQSSFKKDFLFIIIENPTAEPVQIINNTIATTKENKRSHGIGLRSIRMSAEKYAGVIKLASVDNTFSVAIDLDFHH